MTEKNYNTKFYSLDAIISVGYRVSSYKATQFRRWATSVLREYLIKGFTLDDERLKQGSTLFGKDYFDELLERIREIRASERRFYQRVTDIYRECSIDYDPESPITKEFYAHIQDKLHYAIHGHTAAELKMIRADATKPKMGLTSYKNEKTGGKITKLDVTIGKNYLTEEEIRELERLVSMYLDWAEGFARRRIPMTMKDWAQRLDGFLSFNEYQILNDYGKKDVSLPTGTRLPNLKNTGLFRIGNSSPTLTSLPMK
ncbi:virulence RhuM family protein [Oxalobacter formigenes]|nr:virulence RhuM family protein [Oxalobacter formigenes]